jgi:hypothetical protein
MQGDLVDAPLGGIGGEPELGLGGAESVKRGGEFAVEFGEDGVHGALASAQGYTEEDD